MKMIDLQQLKWGFFNVLTHETYFRHEVRCIELKPAHHHACIYINARDNAIKTVRQRYPFVM